MQLNTTHFDVSLRHHLFADELDLELLDSRFYSNGQDGMVGHGQSEQFIQYLLTVMNQHYGLKVRVELVVYKI